MKLILFFLIAYGTSNILVFGSIFSRLRSFLEKISPNFFYVLITCMMCTPFYVGLLGSATIWSPTEYYGLVTEGVKIFSLFTIPKIVVSLFLDACLTSGTVWLIHSVQEATERHHKNL